MYSESLQEVGDALLLLVETDSNQSKGKKIELLLWLWWIKGMFQVQALWSATWHAV